MQRRDRHMARGRGRRGGETRRLRVERLEARRLLAVDVGQLPGELGITGEPGGEADDGRSVARMWNEQLLDAIRVDTPRPTVHARNLFHTSVAMYDAWAAFDPVASPYMSGESIPLDDVPDLEAAMNEAVSFAAYRVLTSRFAHSPGAATSLTAFDSLMNQLGYDAEFASTVGNSPAAVGNRVAAGVLARGLADGANEANNYQDTSGYAAVNEPGVVVDTGVQLVDPNHWQPLVVEGHTQSFLTPHWANVSTFASTRSGPDEVLLDPGLPPQLGGPGDQEFKEAIVRVLEFASRLDPAQNVMIDISPGAIGNNPLGTDDGVGHPVNPVTGQPYAPNIVNAADHGRLLAEFWADGPRSETPPGHWNTIANDVNDRRDALGLPRQIGGQGQPVDELEWDVKLYFALNAAVHDAGVAAWDVKEVYDYVRPITMVRYMGGRGQSSDPAGPAYHPHGLPLVDQLIEVITEDSVAQGRHAHLSEHLGQIAVYSWVGHPEDPEGVGGVDWILAEDWLPYQAVDFVTPAFAGYVSGHSSFSRASAEVLTRFTGSPYFPNGLGEFHAAAGEFLRFEGGPSADVTLQWATYYDAADEAGISRLHGGIHVDADDYEGRRLGSQAGIAAYGKALDFFEGNGLGQLDLQLANAGTTLVRRAGSNLEVLNQAGQLLASEPLDTLRSLSILGGDGNDTLLVDFRTGGVFSLAGGIQFDAQRGGNDRLVFRGAAESEVVELHDDWLRLNSLTIWTTGIDGHYLAAGGGDNRFRLVDPSLDGRVDLVSGRGDDTFQLVPSAARMTLQDAGGTDTLDYRESAHGIQLNLAARHRQYLAAGRFFVQLQGEFENVVGTSQNDVIHGNGADNVLWGGSGNDVLMGRSGNDVLLGGSGRDVLQGQGGDDILSGDQGDDTLLDFWGENLLIGGAGRDLLNAGHDEDLLVSGSTLYDHYVPALQAILAEWTRPTSWTERMGNLEQGGGLNGSYLLRRDETVFGDGQRDVLLSGRGRDWLLDDPEDRRLS